MCLKERSIKSEQIEVLDALIAEHVAFVDKEFGVSKELIEARKAEREEVEALEKKLRLFWST